MSNQFSSPIPAFPFTQTAETLWEPIWQLQVTLSPCEQALLAAWPLRRLGYVRTFGAGGLMLPTQHSRLSHVRGVFALAAHLRPDDPELRLAALLHDVGHGPFSHSAEHLPGFDHHAAGREIILGPEIGGILRRFDFEPARIVALAEGNPPNPVRTQNGLLHLDHLDFFVRDPFVCGWHSPLPAEILAQLYLAGANVAADLATAEHLVERILFEHQLFTAPTKIVAEAVLQHLFRLGSQKGILSAAYAAVTAMTDADLLSRLAQANDPDISAWLERLLHRPHTLTVRRLQPAEPAPPNALNHRFEQPYLNEPLVDGQPVSQRSERAASLLAQARTLLGTYLVE
jgi:HD superfamily phosphohydrolase